MIAVFLFPDEIAAAILEGKRRFRYDVAHGYTDRAKGRDGQQMSINGALGEAAFNAWGGETFPPIPNPYGAQVPDNEGNINVKTADAPHKNLWVIKSRFDPDCRYVLADCSPLPVIDLLGWKWGHEIASYGWTAPYKDNPTWLYPRGKVSHMLTLKKLPTVAPKPQGHVL